MFNIRFKVVINVLLVVFIICTIAIYDTCSVVAADTSSNIAAREKQKMERAVKSLKRGFSGAQSGIKKSLEEFYPVYNEIKTLSENGNFAKLSKEEQAVYRLKIVKSIVGFVKAYDENREEMFNGIENFQGAIGSAVVNALDISGTIDDEAMLIKSQLRTAVKNYNGLKSKYNKVSLQYDDCEMQGFKSNDCKSIKRKMRRIMRQKKSIYRTIKAKKQKTKLAKLNKKLTDQYNDQLLDGTGYAMTFLQMDANMSEYRDIVRTYAGVGPEGFIGSGSVLGFAKIEKFVVNFEKISDALTDGLELIDNIEMMSPGVAQKQVKNRGEINDEMDRYVARVEQE